MVSSEQLYSQYTSATQAALDSGTDLSDVGKTLAVSVAAFIAAATPKADLRERLADVMFQKVKQYINQIQ